MIVGANYLGNNRCTFTVWAPLKKRMVLHLVHPHEQKIEMQRVEWGYFNVTLEDIAPGTRYYYRPEGEKDIPDPASHYQPEGVHGPSEVVDHSAYGWQDEQWRGLPLKELVLYELHVGTFTPEGTFEAIIPRLDALVQTGINVIELMPVNQFPGPRNWGYDGVYPYAVQNSYGGPQGLKRLVDACHQKGIAVFLDVVYNHLGPEGNYFKEYGPYFTDNYKTPWGDALNFDGAYSDGVRDYFSSNPLHWFGQYHMDGLRCDAIHTVFDNGAVHFWDETTAKVKALEQRLGRSLHMVAESDLNSPRVVKASQEGGYGFEAQWLDDFHHALYVLLDKKGKERYEDFGRMHQLAKAYKEGFVHSGEYVSFRKRRHGASSAGISGQQFIAFNLNHDQVGNRVKGERLCMLVDMERVKIAAAALLLSPYIPMLFMGEEYADDTPFFYFVSHSDPELIKAVQEGRKKEFENYQWSAEPPDPQAEKTFTDSKIHWEHRTKGRHHMVLNWHQQLIRLRRTQPILQNFDKNNIRVDTIGEQGFVLIRQSSDGLRHFIVLFNLSEQDATYTMPHFEKLFSKLLHSKEQQWMEGNQSTAPILENINSGETVHLPSLSVMVYASA